MSLVLDAPASLRPVSLAQLPRTITVGLIGLGQVGQAVARLAGAASRLKESGLQVRIAGALVRDVDKPRRCNRPPRLTSNASAFLRGSYDVVIEALGTIDPARSLVSRFLGRGIPVVTANKALVARHGAELSALAARRGTTLRYEASALAGIPFLGTLAARPLVSDVQRFTAIVNGTSNFILSRLERGQTTFAVALAEAQQLGLCEPDPSRDIEGLDAGDKLALLASLFGWGGVPAASFEVNGIAAVTAEDCHIARSLNMVIKPIVTAEKTEAGISGFVGPALLPVRHPLASLVDTLSGIQFSGRWIQDLFFSGPGAGPDITAATILDDVVEASNGPAQPARVKPFAPRPATLAAAPATPWLLRAQFPGVVPDANALTALFGAHDCHATYVSDPVGSSRWLLTTPLSRTVITARLGRLALVHRITCTPTRALCS